MNKKISFHNMPHSEPMEQHADLKLETLFRILDGEANLTPFSIEFWLKANKVHPHHAAELHLRTAHFDLHAHDEGPDMYIVIDNTVDKMVKLLKKEKERRRDEQRKPDTDKSGFGEDKYTLGD
jgi:ribosomal subunit interface protein